MNKILNYIRDVDTVATSLTEGDQVTSHRTISHLGNLNLLIESHLHTSLSTPSKLEADSFSPSLVFLKDVGVSLMEPGRNREIIQDLLQHKFSNADVETANKLLALREQLYPPGKLRPTPRPTFVENMEVHMGDKFNNISGTIINRSLVENSFNKVKRQAGSEAADVLAKVTELIEASGNRQAAELFEQFNEELQRPEPRKSVLSTAWDSIVKIVPAIGSIAGAAAAMAKLFS